MARKKRKKQGSTQSSSTEHALSSLVYILNDNLSKTAATALARENTVIFTTQSLGLPQNVDDPTLLKKFSSVASEASATAWIATSDRGKGDKVMPKEVDRYPGLFLLTTSISGNNQELAIDRLYKTHGFKIRGTYHQRFKSIHLSQMGSILRIEYITLKNKQKIKDIPDVF